MASITLSGLKKSYGTAQVIKGVDITIEDGEFVVFVGPSGCGKSTLLRMIAGLEDITAGTLTVGGRVVNDLPQRARRGDGVSILCDLSAYDRARKRCLWPDDCGR